MDMLKESGFAEGLAGRRTAILMATYNGGRFLAEQLDSLFAQTFCEWTLYVHDDGSSDDTAVVLAEYARMHPNMTIMDYPPVGGSKDNFLSMLRRIEADYYFFCDQDDVWLPMKVEETLSAIAEAERQCPDKPVVAFCDLSVVDQNLNVIAGSFMGYQGIHPQFLSSFSELAASNVCPGCAMAFNLKARDATVYPAGRATMHDAWVVLCTARQGGRLVWIDKPLVLYRQHGDNVLGARDVRGLTMAYRISHLRRVIRQNADTYRMLRALGYGSILKYAYYKLLYKKRSRKAT